MVLETALNGRTDVLITLNTVHFSAAERFGLTVLTPGAFLCPHTLSAVLQMDSAGCRSSQSTTLACVCECIKSDSTVVSRTIICATSRHAPRDPEAQADPCRVPGL